VEEAVDSILNQTFRDFEFIIINDGSTDNTLPILKRYTDKRITLINRENRGIAASLNQAVALAQGEYVAQMHSDDIARPDRLQKQVAFLKTHQEVGILGTALQIIDENGRSFEFEIPPPSDDLEIRWTILMKNCFRSPAVMMRRDVLIDNGLRYNELIAEDYDLWTRMLNFTRGANLQEHLIQYRVHRDSRSGQYGESQPKIKENNVISLRTIRQQIPDFAITLQQVTQLQALFVNNGKFMPEVNTRRVTLAETYLDMLDAFIRHHQGEPGVEKVRRQGALNVATVILRSPRPSGWTRIMKELITMDATLPWYYLGHLIKNFNYRLKRRIRRSFSAAYS